MSNNLFQDGTDDTKQGFEPTGSKDSYGDRFEVIERTTSNKPHSPIIKKYNNLKSSDRIFSRHRDKNPNLGGHVNMKNVSRISVEEDEDEAKNDFESNDVFSQPAKLDEEPTSSSGNSVNLDTNNDKVQESEAEKENDSGLESLRSTGLDSLFSSTAEDDSNTSAASTTKIKKSQIADSADKKNLFKKKADSTDVKQSDVSLSSDKDLKRKVTVIRPVEFNSSASELSTALKNGDVVVLSIRHTNSSISNRILDFAFGCASITGANVSLEADKTYVFTKGPAISDSERIVCINNGISLKGKKN